LSTDFIFNNEWNGSHLRHRRTPHRDQRQFRSAREGAASIMWVRSALPWDQIKLKLSSPPLPVTCELIDVGTSSF
jgi:hypothetical protein